MTLDPERQREIRQLMWVADQYLELAAPAKAEAGRRLGDTAAAFMPGTTPDEATRHAVFLSAHVTSAATRLATVDEILSRPEHTRPGYDDCVDYFGKKVLERPLSLPSASDWLHVMLRHNVGHREPPDGPADLSRRRGERQELLKGLSFPATYQILEGITSALRQHLQREHSIICL